MAFNHTNSKGRSYYLHKKDVTLKGGRVQTIYYFAKVPGDAAIDELPPGYMVIENTRTGLPFLKKKPQ